MKFKEERPLANSEAAMAKLLEIANALESRRGLGRCDQPCIPRGGNVTEYGATMHRAVADGWMETHPSGAYVKLTQKDTDKFV